VRARSAAAKLAHQKRLFLDALGAKHLVSAAAKAAGVHRSTPCAWRESDENFARRWDEIVDESTDLLEREAYRRAAVGVEKPVYQGGGKVGTVREFSDTLLIFLLKARRPAVYRDHHQVEHVGPEGGPVQFDALGDLSKLSDRDLASLQRILARARGRTSGDR
jgi:hypothetical protein